MKYLIDVHTHTISSGHAYSTLRENIEIAKAKGLKYYGISDHTQGIPNGAHTYYFSNLRVLPREIEGVCILRGCEANVINEQGEIDIEEAGLRSLDYVIASLHAPCYSMTHTLSENMKAYEGVCRNPKVTIIGHPDDGRYPCNYEKLVDLCKETDTLIEINNSSLSPLGYRENCIPNSKKILELCKEKKHPVILNSDAHICFDVANVAIAESILEEVDFPKELVVNYNEELIEKYFLKKFK